MKKIDKFLQTQHIVLLVTIVALLVCIVFQNRAIFSRLKPKEEKLELKIGESYEVERDYGGFKPDTYIVTLEDFVNGYIKINDTRIFWDFFDGWYKKGMRNWYQSIRKRNYKIRFIKQVKSKKEKWYPMESSPGWYKNYRDEDLPTYQEYKMIDTAQNLQCDTIIWQFD